MPVKSTKVTNLVRTGFQTSEKPVTSSKEFWFSQVEIIQSAEQCEGTLLGYSQRVAWEK